MFMNWIFLTLGFCFYRYFNLFRYFVVIFIIIIPPSIFYLRIYCFIIFKLLSVIICTYMPMELCLIFIIQAHIFLLSFIVNFLQAILYYNSSYFNFMLLLCNDFYYKFISFILFTHQDCLHRFISVVISIMVLFHILYDV
jgi:hypothetical protein